MKQYLFFLLASLVVLQSADGSECMANSECSSMCCGYYDMDMTAEGSSYYSDMSMMDSSMMESSMMMDGSMMDSSMMKDKTMMMCVSDSMMSSMPSMMYMEYRMVCSYSTLLTISVGFLAILGY